MQACPQKKFRMRNNRHNLFWLQFPSHDIKFLAYFLYLKTTLLVFMTIVDRQKQYSKSIIGTDFLHFLCQLLIFQACAIL